MVSIQKHSKSPCVDHRNDDWDLCTTSDKYVTSTVPVFCHWRCLTVMFPKILYKASKLRLARLYKDTPNHVLDSHKNFLVTHQKFQKLWTNWWKFSCLDHIVLYDMRRPSCSTGLIYLLWVIKPFPATRTLFIDLILYVPLRVMTCM